MPETTSLVQSPVHVTNCPPVKEATYQIYNRLARFE